MRFIVCPFCKTKIKESEFPSSRKGREHIVMLCPACKRRLGFTLNRGGETGDEHTPAQQGTTNTSNALTPSKLSIVENRYAYAAEYPLYEGENRVGRYNDKHTDLEVAIRTSDPSMDRVHCSIFAEADSRGRYDYFIVDDNSLTGTFVNTKEVEQGEKRLLADGDVITLGATSILFTNSQNTNE